MSLRPQFSGDGPLAGHLNAICDWVESNRILPGPYVDRTPDGIHVLGSRSTGSSESGYPFKAISVPVLPDDPPADPFAIAVDRGHVVNIDGVPFAPSNLRAPIVLPAETEDIPIYLDLTLNPETGEILSGTVEFSDTGEIPASPEGESGTGLGPAKAYKQLFTITTTEASASLSSVAEHSKTNFALIRYVKEAVYDNSTWAMAFISA